MTSERRLSARHPLDLQVQILFGRRRFCGARGRNLSIQGMYLSPQNLTLPVGTPVDLELACLGRHWLIEALVVHRQGGGIGVMFREPQEALYQGLLQGAIPSAGHQGDRSSPPAAPIGRPLLARH